MSPTGTGAADNPKGAAKERSRKPKDMPRRPLSAYNLFFAEERERILRAQREGVEQPDLIFPTDEELAKNAASTGKRKPPVLFQALARCVGKRWKALPADQREKYQGMAEKEMEEYREKIQEYELQNGYHAGEDSGGEEGQAAKPRPGPRGASAKRRATEETQGSQKPAAKQAKPPPHQPSVSTGTVLGATGQQQALYTGGMGVAAGIPPLPPAASLALPPGYVSPDTLLPPATPVGMMAASSLHPPLNSYTTVTYHWPQPAVPLLSHHVYPQSLPGVPHPPSPRLETTLLERELALEHELALIRQEQHQLRYPLTSAATLLTPPQLPRSHLLAFEPGPSAEVLLSRNHAALIGRLGSNETEKQGEEQQE